MTASERPTLFVSDLHLAEFRPRVTERFRTFCREVAPGAAALYILGDLFEVWIGDDTLAEPFNRGIADSLKQVSDAGVPTYFLCGNRDFLIAREFAAAAGITLIRDPTELTLGGRRILLMHGDTLCTDDLAYQAFRRQVRNPAVQAQFLALPVEVRRQQAGAARAQSEEHKQAKPVEIMDVSTDTVVATLREHGYPTLIHGHTHRPATHVHPVDGHACERWVLADWRDEFVEYLQVDAAGWSRRTLPEAVS